MTGRLGARTGALPEVAIVEVELTPDELRGVRRWLLIAGPLALVAGLACVAVPAMASVAIALFIGWFLIGTSIAMAADAFARRSPRHRTMRLLIALLTLVIGVALVADPDGGTLSLTFLLVVWFLGAGVLLLATWWQQRGLPGAGLTAFSGGLSLVLGLLIGLDLPSSADWAVGLLVGVNLAFWGVRMLVAAFAIKRLLPS